MLPKMRLLDYCPSDYARSKYLDNTSLFVTMVLAITPIHKIFQEIGMQAARYKWLPSKKAWERKLRLMCHLTGETAPMV